MPRCPADGMSGKYFITSVCFSKGTTSCVLTSWSSGCHLRYNTPSCITNLSHCFHIRFAVHDRWQISFQPGLLEPSSRSVIIGGMSLSWSWSCRNWAGSQPGSVTVFEEVAGPHVLCCLLVMTQTWPSSTSGFVSALAFSVSLSSLVCCRLQALHGFLDKASALLCFVPGRWTTVWLYVPSSCNHRATWPVGFFKFLIQFTAALSVLSTTGWPNRYGWKCFRVHTTARSSLRVVQ